MIHKGSIMKDKARKEGVKGESCGYYRDFKVLTPTEKRGILKTAKTLLKVQKEDAKILADAPPLPMEAEKEGLG
jgi:hypothetical protein